MRAKEEEHIHPTHLTLPVNSVAFTRQQLRLLHSFTYTNIMLKLSEESCPCSLELFSPNTVLYEQVLLLA